MASFMRVSHMLVFHRLIRLIYFASEMCSETVLYREFGLFSVIIVRRVDLLTSL